MIILLIVLLTIVNIGLRISIGGIEVAVAVSERADKLRQGMEKTAVRQIKKHGNRTAYTTAKVAKFGADTAMVGVKVVGRVAKTAALLSLKASIKVIKMIISAIRDGLVALGSVVIILDVVVFILIMASTAGYLVLFGGTDENGNLTLNTDIIATLGTPSAEGSISGSNSSAEGPVFTKYNLSDDEILQLASLCQQEQGTVAGAAAEASLMCNLFESSRGDDYDSLVDYVRNSGWFANAGRFMDARNADSDVVNVVDHVIRDGLRVLPGYIDEHDYFGDITSATNEGVAIDASDRGAYKKNVTIIDNRYGSTYTFYCFPDETSDPFGYTSEELRAQVGDDCYTLEEAIAGVATARTLSAGNGEFLLSCENPDSNYQGQTWEVDDRELLERLVSSEFGDDYNGAVLVAQAVRDGMVEHNTHDVSWVIDNYNYTGLSGSSSQATQIAKNAVEFVFDRGGSGVQHRLKTMYKAGNGYSSWHESLNLVIQYKNAKFFDFDE